MSQFLADVLAGKNIRDIEPPKEYLEDEKSSLGRAEIENNIKKEGLGKNTQQ